LRLRQRQIFFIIILAITILSSCFILYWKFKIQPQQTTDIQLNLSNLDITYGNDKAPLTIFVYSRYNCVFCRKFFNDSFPLIKKDYIDSGKIRFVVKLIDFSNDVSVEDALKMAVCINRFGNFEKLNQLLMAEPDVVYTQQFREITEEFIEKDPIIAECMLGGDAENYLNGNFNEFIKLKLKGTPTFIINNKIYKGYKSYPEMKKVIEKELKVSLR
jgi:protein-disulfide isomerase